ncbi:hypothetical protein K2173_008339 [Erythroxylum novogranatense]|uniref:hydroxymethylglutaryl-CoA lyase n=1 Tax=Erythroxylum novogranatense TaxID=1862640 RepID=A0AAV8TL83_9ROSI|nr:hypothetical protein K2173_008339 [Erythroxylum novogranatense]
MFDDAGMGNCWIDGRNCSSSNCCKEDYEEYTREIFPWRRHTREPSGSDSFIIGRFNDSCYFSYHHHISKINDKDIRHKTNKLADARDVMEAVHTLKGCRLPVLTPNVKGFEAAVTAGAKEIAVFASASESFSNSNINSSIEESFVYYRAVSSATKALSIPVRGYVSCVIGCPVEGEISPSKVAYLANKFYDMGCFEISLSDTIGIAS